MVWWFYWDNALVHTAAMVQDSLAARGIQVLEQTPLFAGPGPRLLLLLPQDEGRAGWQPPDPRLLEDLGGVATKFTIKDFAATVWHWLDRSKKCVWLRSNSVEKP